MDTVKLYLNTNPALRERLETWFGPTAKYIHIWEQDGTFFVVLKTYDNFYCVRCFTIGDKMEISVDLNTSLERL